jgi:shikimate dehydrogenase
MEISGPVSSESLQEIVCCMGQPVAGNPTQFMVERAFAAAGLAWRYLTLEVSPDGLGDAVRGMRAMGFAGGNFTIPHKVAVVPLLDELTEAAQLMGAVNCVYFDGDKLVGENTDGKGFVQSLSEVTNPEGKSVVILGAGGAARAIAVELGLSKVAQITVVNRTPERGQELADLLKNKAGVSSEFVEWKGNYEVAEGTEILINATSIGLNDESQRVPINAKTLNAETIVADVIVNPPNTRFLSEAADHGCTTLNGLGMLVNQAVIGFKIWTGVDPDPAVMREALEEFLML